MDELAKLKVRIMHAVAAGNAMLAEALLAQVEQLFVRESAAAYQRGREASKHAVN